MAAKKKTRKASKPKPKPKKAHRARAVAAPPRAKKKAEVRKKSVASRKPEAALAGNQGPPPIGKTEHPLIVRTHFADPIEWDAIRETIGEPVDDGFLANVDYLDDRAYEGVTKERLLDLLGKGYTHSFIIVADRAAMWQPEHPLLVVDLDAERGRELRALASQIQSIENNLSLSNMEFDEFAENAGDDGVFRGF